MSIEFKTVQKSNLTIFHKFQRLKDDIISFLSRQGDERLLDSYLRS